MENRPNEIIEMIRNKERIWELMAREHERKIKSLWITIIIFSQNKVLVIKKEKNSNSPYIYDLPNGKVNENEKLDNGAKRVAYQFTNLETKKFYGYQGRNDFKLADNTLCRNFMWVVEAFNPQELKLKDRRSYKWVNKNEIENLSLPMLQKLAIQSFLSLNPGEDPPDPSPKDILKNFLLMHRLYGSKKAKMNKK